MSNSGLQLRRCVILRIKRSKFRGPSCSDFGGLNGRIVRTANTRRHTGWDSALHRAKDGVSQRLAMCKSPNLMPRVNLNYVIETYLLLFGRLLTASMVPLHPLVPTFLQRIAMDTRPRNSTNRVLSGILTTNPVNCPPIVVRTLARDQETGFDSPVLASMHSSTRNFGRHEGGVNIVPFPGALSS